MSAHGRLEGDTVGDAMLYAAEYINGAGEFEPAETAQAFQILRAELGRRIELDATA